MRKILREANVFEEGAYDAAKGLITLTVIKPGFNKSKRRFYPTETLKRDFKVFEGSKMFIDHATEGQERARPEGSVRDWAASFTNLWVEDNGRVRATAAVIDEDMKKRLENLAQHGKLGEMGVSIRAAGIQSEATIEGHPTQLVEKLLVGRSVDFVTYPAAGGGVEVFESERDELDLDVVSIAQLRERRPDLVELIESNGGTAMNEVEKTLREEIEKGKTEIKRLTEAADEQGIKKLKAELKEKTDLLAEATKVKSKADAGEVLGKFLLKSKLPKQAQERLRARFAEAETDEGMEEAVADMIKFMKEVAPDAVTDLGGEEENASEREGKVDLVKSFRETGLNEEEAKIAAGVTA